MNQKTKNTRLAFLLAILCVSICAWAFLAGGDSKPAVDKTIFQVPRLDKIDRVLIHSSTGESDLRFNGTEWQVNGQSADRGMITVLFATLKQTEAKRKVANQQLDSIRKQLEHGTKVQCYEGATLVKEIKMIGEPGRGDTFFAAEDGIPYLVNIPGYRVYIASIFDLAPNDWRDKRIFSFNWQNIKSLEVSFGTNTQFSFKGSFKEGIFGIEGIATDTTKLDQFMDALFTLQADRVLSAEQASAYDSLYRSTPRQTIRISDIGGNDYTLKVYGLSKKQTVVAKRNDDAVELSTTSLSRISRPKNYFIKSASSE